MKNNVTLTPSVRVTPSVRDLISGGDGKDWLVGDASEGSLIGEAGFWTLPEFHGTEVIVERTTRNAANDLDWEIAA